MQINSSAGIYIPHVRRRGEEIEAQKTVRGYRARRWIVKVCLSWFNRFRKLLVRFDKTDSSYVPCIIWHQPLSAGEKLKLFTEKL
jgi:putative transposase